MFFYFGKTFTATATGRQLKTVTCEKCATVFHYEIARSSVGSASAPYMLGQDAARCRAEQAAERLLAKRLARDVELVPCPTCKWVNHAAIMLYRKSKYRGWMWIGMAILFLGAFLEIILLENFETLFRGEPSKAVTILLLVALVTISLALAMFILQWVLRRRFDPNRSVDGNPRVPPGTPPALVRSAPSASGSQTFVAVPSELSNLQTETQWATFRLGQLSLEPICCQCLDLAVATYKQPVTLGKVLPVPLCQHCLRKLHQQWWLYNLGVLPIAGLVGWALASIPREIDDLGRTMATYLVSGIAAIIGFAIIDHWLKPYRVRTVDKDRGVWKIRFKNPAYTAILIRKIGEADGIYHPTAS